MPNHGDDAKEPPNPGAFKQLPYNLQKLVKAVGFPFLSSELDDEEREIYELIRHGRCMTCKKVLGRNANFIVSRYGIVGGYCSGVCHSDMAVMGFLQETFEDMHQKIEFRGSAEPAVEDTPDTIGDDPAFEDDEGEEPTEHEG